MRHPEHILKLIRLYSKAQETLVKIIAEHEAAGTLTMYQESLLEQVERELERIRLQSMEWSQQTIPEQYMQGITEVAAALAEHYGIEVPGYDAFSRLHTRAIDLLVRNTTEDLIDATNFIGRQIRDSVRQAGLETIAQKVATGSTVRQTKINLVNNLVDQGLNGIRDKRGRMISLDAYASTVARSTTREATNTATINHLKELNYDLVKMSSHATTCPVCSVLQGRVYSLTGRTPGYPVLTRAFGSHANIHPNCRHVLVPYIPELQDDAEADRLFSNRPFDIDPRSQKDIDRYNKQQNEKAKLRNDRNQYQRYRLVLGNDAPKTFAGFRAMKSSDSEHWQQLQSDYRDVSNAKLLPNHDKAVIPIEKIIGYSLNKDHHLGKNKAIVFESALGYNVDTANDLRRNILSNVHRYKAVNKGKNNYGTRYEVVMDLKGPNGKTAKVLTAWMIDNGKEVPRLISAYVDD